MALQWVNETSNNENESDAHWMSVSDLMAGLMLLFVLSLSVVLYQVKDRIEEQQRLRIIFIQAIQQKLEANGIDVEVDVVSGDFSLSEKVLFDFNSAELTVQGRKTIYDFVSIFSREIFENAAIASQIKRVLIEGHSSSSGSYLANMQLSLQRASAVMVSINSTDFANKADFMSRLAIVGRGFNDADHTQDLSIDRKVTFRIEFVGDKDSVLLEFSRGVL